MRCIQLLIVKLDRIVLIQKKNHAKNVLQLDIRMWKVRMIKLLIFKYSKTFWSWNQIIFALEFETNVQYRTIWYLSVLYLRSLYILWTHHARSVLLCIDLCRSLLVLFLLGLVRVMMFNATFSNIADILWRSVLLVEETGVPRENHLLHRKSLSNFCSVWPLHFLLIFYL
jgi:hypothetical protein